MVQQVKDKGRFYKTHNKKVLQSVTEVSDIDAIIEQVEEADRLFSSQNPIPQLLLDGESSSSTSVLTPEERRKQQKIEETRHAGSLRVPRRPPWHAGMTVDELDANEKQAFLVWRRGLAKLEDNDKLVLTPFEKNLDIWRQLWRVVERSDLLVMVVDARNPLFYRCPDLEEYVREVDEHKRTMLLINKADLLPYSVRLRWANYFRYHGILFLFWSAKAATAALEGKQLNAIQDMQGAQDPDDINTKIYGRDELLARLQSEAEEIMMMRISDPKSLDRSPSHSQSPVRKTRVNSPSESVTVGFVGYPNVGKSSTINALVGEKRTGVTNTPGKTKHFQTIIITEKLTLCDCPGLVFPSFTSSRYEMIACGVLPIDRMTVHREAVQVVADNVPRKRIEEIYKITLPKPKPYEPQSRPPLASELLRAYCASRGWTASSGLPDETRAARLMLKDFIDGKLPHFQLPPGIDDDDDDDDERQDTNDVDDDEDDDDDDERKDTNDAADDDHHASGLSDIDESDSSDIEDVSVTNLEVGPNLEDVMNDLDSFDIANGMAKEKDAKARKKPMKAPHKLHKKVQRKKDRSWRVGNDGRDGGDGMPLARVFQKPVNSGPLRP